MALPTMSAAPTNTYIETTAPNVREDLADVIYQIDKADTPMVSLCSISPAEQVNTEWLVQELYPAANVPQPEGFTAAMSPAKKPLRLGNVCQILARTVAVSDTLRVVDQVGDEEYNRQIVARGLELRRPRADHHRGNGEIDCRSARAGGIPDMVFQRLGRRRHRRLPYRRRHQRPHGRDAARPHA